jgi:hypothetical protein
MGRHRISRTMSRNRANNGEEDGRKYQPDQQQMPGDAWQANGRTILDPVKP